MYSRAPATAHRRVRSSEVDRHGGGGLAGPSAAAILRRRPDCREVAGRCQSGSDNLRVELKTVSLPRSCFDPVYPDK